MYSKILLALALGLTSTARADTGGSCCYWSASGDACGDCGAPAAPGSFCAGSEDQCTKECGATWCPGDVEADDEPNETCVGDYSACQGCSGEQCTYCAAEQDVNCCVAEGGDLYECCEASAPFSWRYSMNECASVADQTPQPTPKETCKGDYSACNGCQGQQCTYCRAEEDIKCCVAEGGDATDCCANSSPFEWVSDLCPTADDDDDDDGTVAPTATPKTEWRVGALGESCDATCEGVGLSCSEDYLKESNPEFDFVSMMEELTGEACKAIKGPKQNKAAPYINTKGKCMLKDSSSTFTCEQASSTKQRVCACSRVNHVSRSSRFMAAARMGPVSGGVGLLSALVVGGLVARHVRKGKGATEQQPRVTDDIEADLKPEGWQPVGKKAPKARAFLEDAFAAKTNEMSAPAATADDGSD